MGKTSSDLGQRLSISLPQAGKRPSWAQTLLAIVSALQPCPCALPCTTHTRHMSTEVRDLTPSFPLVMAHARRPMLTQEALVGYD